MKTANKFLMAACALLALPMSAYASCSISAGGAADLTLTLPTSLSVPRDQFNVGDAIWTSPRLGNYGPIKVIDCTGTANDYSWGVILQGQITTWPIASNVGGSPSIPAPSRVVYQSNIAGIGVALYFYDDASGPNTPSRLPLYSLTDKAYWKTLYTAAQYRNAHDFQLQLVKTGPISTGGSLNLNGTYAEVWYGGLNAPGAIGSVNSAKLRINSDLPITVPTCQLANSGIINVPLPKVSVTALGPGVDAGRTNFDIPMNCSGTKVYYTLSGNFDPSNYTLLIPTGTASGVRLQLRDRATNNAMVLDGNHQYFLADTTGQSNVQQTIKLAAQYHQPSSVATVTPGSVNGSVALNMLYQ